MPSPLVCAHGTHVGSVAGEADDALEVSGRDVPFGSVDPGEPEERGYFAQPGNQSDLAEPCARVPAGCSRLVVKSGSVIAWDG